MGREEPMIVAIGIGTIAVLTPSDIHYSGEVSSSPEPDRAAGTTTSPVTDDAPAAARSADWQVLVWDDPVNLMTYVEYVFMKHFGFDRATAHDRMLAVHNEGKAVVATGSRERAEAHVQAMHSYGLHATMRPAPR